MAVCMHTLSFVQQLHIEQHKQGVAQTGPGKGRMQRDVKTTLEMHRQQGEHWI